MKRHRRFLAIFLVSTASGWATAHFTVGNAGAVVLRAAVSEARMPFARAEKRSAAARVASLTGKSLAERTAIIAGWSELASVAEIRHLYDALDQLPDDLRRSARDVLLGRWAVLDPDSLLLAALRESDTGKRAAILHAFCRHWAAGRSPDEIADLLVNVAGDVKKFLPEPPVGGYFKPGEALAYGNFFLRRFGLDPRAALALTQRLNIKLPADGYAAIFSALAKTDVPEAQRRLSEITDPSARRAAAAGIASQLAFTDPDAALAICGSGDREMLSAITPGYLKSLLALPPEEAWQRAGEFSDKYRPGGSAIIFFLKRMALRDPAGLMPWMESRPSSERQNVEFVMSLGPGPELQRAFLSYLAEAPPGSGIWMMPAMAIHSRESDADNSMIQWLAASGRTDLQIGVAAALLQRGSDHFDFNTTEMSQLLEMLHAAPLSPSVRELLNSKDQADDQTRSIAESVANHWPESAALLDDLSPAARETALPGFIRGTAVHDPARAAEFLAAQPDTAGAAEAAATLAESWARYDFSAAQRWSQSLSGARRTRATAALQSTLDSWELPQPPEPQ